MSFLAAAGMVVAGGSALALTATDTGNDATITLNAGTVTVNVTTDLAFASQTLTGNDIVLTSAASVPDITVNDSRGTGQGWTLTLAAADYTDGGTETIDAANFTYINPSSGTLGSVNWPSADPDIDNHDTAQPLSSAVGLLTAGTDEGMGDGTFSLDVAMFGLTIPAVTKAGSYTSDLTATVTYDPVP